jgi:ATP-dependent DNA helicase RecQ
VQRVAALLLHAPEPVPPEQLARESALSPRTLSRVVDVLVKAGVLRVLPGGELVYGIPGLSPEEAVMRADSVTEARERLQRSRVEMMQAYAETRGCRRQPLLSYFGAPAGPPCGNCDNCAAGGGETDPEQSPYPLASRVAHAEWGQGLVMRYEDDRIVVLFDQVGYKTLSLDAVAARGLLEPVG